ncbi:MAG: spore coat U domain-containing protein [Methylocystis sp.]|nr:spore coat U domain-containing protein [Methylocystis sp.]
MLRHAVRGFRELAGNKWRLCAALALASVAALCSANAAFAATSTSTFGVTMTINASCTIVSTATLNFGSQGVLAAAVNQTTTLQVQCTNTTPYNIGLDAGTGSGATVNVRKMTSGSNTTNYSLYSDGARTVVWGITVGANTVSATANGGLQNFTIYGQVPAQTTPAPGVYTDTITVTVTY